MQTLNNVHQQFAEFFKSETLKPFAFLVSKKLSEGHICIKVNDAAEELAESVFYQSNKIDEQIKRLGDDPLVTHQNGAKQPFVLHNGRLYLQRYFAYETAILQRIKSFVLNEEKDEEKAILKLQQHADLIKTLFTASDLPASSIAVENIDWQLVAALSGVINNFTIITGGPGTGKTTTVAKILAILFAINPNLTVALAAPTGKAAVRMAESLKAASLNVSQQIKDKFETIKPGTIHRLLKYIPDSPYFKHNKLNPLNEDVVIVDESSMIDVALFSKLLDAIGPETKLIMLGDKDQLASVEAGSMFGDLCKTQSAIDFISKERIDLVNSFIADAERQVPASYSLAESKHLLSQHIIELKRSRRFTSDKGIGRFSKAIIGNNSEVLQQYLQQNQDAQVVVDQNYDPQIFEEFISGYEEYIKEADIKMALQKLNKLRVLCAFREGEQGLYKLNEAVENYLRKRKLIEKNAVFYTNRPIIITKNYYSLELFNGDVGIIRPDENGIQKAWFETSNHELKSVLPGYIAEAETVYAMTIHKSQGSEYDNVMVVLPNTTNIPILTRELLYTGVTRAKLKVTVQATAEVLLHTTTGVVQRASGIMERFNE